MESGVYGKYKEYLPQVMDLLVSAVENYSTAYQARYGERAYEHFLYRVKDEASMEKKCIRKGLPVCMRGEQDSMIPADEPLVEVNLRGFSIP